MKITKTFNDKVAVKLLESENLKVGSIETSQKKPTVLAQVIAVSEKCESGVKQGDEVYIDSSYPRITLDNDEGIYIVVEKALVYQA